MKVLVISPGYLPVPATNGGAIEHLIDTITEENEKEKKCLFTIIGIKTNTEIQKNLKEYTNYKYINNNSLIFKIKRIIFSLINKFPNIYIGNAYINEVTKIIKKNKDKYDKVIIENNPLYILKIKKYFKCPIYLHLHNDYLNKDSKLSKKVYYNYDKILTVSNFIGNRVKEIDTNATKVYTLYNGIDTERFMQQISREEKRNIRAKYGIAENDFVYLYTGRLTKQKGIKELVIAFNNLCEKHKNIKLLIVGSSDFKKGKNNSFIKELKALAKNKEIIFTGYIDNSLIWKLYKISDCQVVPSIINEALGDVVIEGLASELPLVVNNVGGIPEIVENDSALLCDKNNLINSLIINLEKIYLNQDLKTRLISNNLNKVKKFSKEIFYKNYIDIISERE